MRRFSTRTVLFWGCLTGLTGLWAQQTESNLPLTSVPRLVRISNTFHPANALPVGPSESVTLSIYREERGGTPLWQETQNVTLDGEARYTVLMGSSLKDGVPLDLFTPGELRWLGVQFNRPGEVEQPRVLLASVPYALKASDAETLGGRPASAYLLSPAAAAAEATNHTGMEASVKESGTAKPEKASLLPNAANAGELDVAINDNGGTITGYSVQNLGGGAAAYSGMLFYDQNGALGQFQGFNNSTHEYRINNIAPNGSINFMIGSSSKFEVANSGNIGIGTTTPGYKLDVQGGQINATGGLCINADCRTAWPSGAGGSGGGTVTQVNSGTGLTGGPITTSGTLSFDTSFGDGRYARLSASNNFAGTQTMTSGNASGAGVSGINTATSGFAVGVQGSTNSATGAGVNGFNNATSGYAVGVSGGTASSSGAGVQGNANVAGVIGVSGFNSATTGYAVGVTGGTASTNGAGVQGNASVAGASGVNGFNSAATGYSVGVSGGTASTSGAGVQGNASAAGVFGVVGFNSATSGFAVGTEGATSSPGGAAIWGTAMSCGSNACTLADGTGGHFSTSTNGTLLRGVSGAPGANTSTAVQVFSVDGHGNGSYSGNLQVNGNLNVGGTISKSGGSFRIDHPLDPENRYLYHSFVESPEMKNIYDGVAILDDKGEATVTLPDWFEALNQDFRYQLTCVGGYSPVYVAGEVSGNQFRIAGGLPALKVSWQVTGVRHDTYANSHRIPVEVEKPAGERGGATTPPAPSPGNGPQMQR